MEKSISFIMNHYVGETSYPMRKVVFSVSESYVSTFLKENNQSVSLDEFVNSYTDAAAEYLYGCAADDGALISSSIIYAPEFLTEYNEHARHVMYKSVLSQESYYWTVFCPKHNYS